MFESSNFSRDNLSREIGRTYKRSGPAAGPHARRPPARSSPRARSGSSLIIIIINIIIITTITILLLLLLLLRLLRLLLLLLLLVIMIITIIIIINQVFSVVTDSVNNDNDRLKTQPARAFAAVEAT